jgi:hypothetical protein
MTYRIWACYHSLNIIVDKITIKAQISVAWKSTRIRQKYLNRGCRAYSGNNARIFDMLQRSPTKPRNVTWIRQVWCSRLLILAINHNVGKAARCTHCKQVGAGSPLKKCSCVQQAWPIRSRVIWMTSLLTDLKKACHTRTGGFRACIILMGPFVLPGRQKSTTKTGVEHPCPELGQINALGRCTWQPRRLAGPMARDPMTWGGRTHMQNFYYNRMIRWLCMETEGISNNMVMLGLTVNDKNSSRNGLQFGRVDTPLNQR